MSSAMLVYILCCLLSRSGFGISLHLSKLGERSADEIFSDASEVTSSSDFVSDAQPRFDALVYRIALRQDGESEQVFVALLPRAQDERGLIRRTLLYFREGVAATTMGVLGKVADHTTTTSRFVSSAPFLWCSIGMVVVLPAKLSDADKLSSLMPTSAERPIFEADIGNVSVNPSRIFKVHDVMRALRLVTEHLQDRKGARQRQELIIGGYGELGGALALSAHRAVEAFPSVQFDLAFSFPMGASFLFPDGLLRSFTAPHKRQALLNEDDEASHRAVVPPWIPIAPVKLCAGADDGNDDGNYLAQQGAEQALQQFTAVGVDVHRISPRSDGLGDDETACLLSATEHLFPSRAAKRRLNKVREVRYPIEAILLLIVAPAVWIIGFTIGGIMRYKWRKAAGHTNVKFRGAGSAWIKLLTKCPCLTLAYGIALPGLFSFLGFYEADWNVDVNMDFDTYVREESDIQFTQDAFRTAQDVQQESLKASYDYTWPLGRRLSHDSGGWDNCDGTLGTSPITFYYEAVGTDSIFNREAVEEIKDFESRIQNFPSWQAMCWKESGSCHCKPPMTSMRLLYPEQALSGNTLTQKFNGLGPLTSESAFQESLDRFQSQGSTWYVDKEWSPSTSTSKYTRSTFYLGRPPYRKMADQLEEWRQELWDEVLHKTDLEKPYKHIIISWQNSDLKSFEVLQYLKHDCIWSAGSLLFVVIVLGLQLRSICLTIAAVTGILLSFSATYYFYYVVLDYKDMTVLNFISVFIIIGIAADDVLVMKSTYTYSATIWVDQKDNNARQRMRWSYREAATAMLVTTATTCGSFFSLTLSSVPVVAAFGWFMGTIVLWNYINVMTILPSAMLIVDLCWESMCACCCPKPEEIPDADPPANLTGDDNQGRSKIRTDHDHQNLTCATRFLGEKFSPCLYRLRFASPCAMFVIAILGAIFGVLNFEQESGGLNIFIEKRNLGRIDDVSSEPFLKYSSKERTKARLLLDEFDSTSTVCPGAKLVGGILEQCSDHGTCEKGTFTCRCNAGYYGIDCGKFLHLGGSVAALPQVIRATRLSSLQTAETKICGTGLNYYGYSGSGACPRQQMHKKVLDVKLESVRNATATWSIIAEPALPDGNTAWIEKIEPSMGTLENRLTKNVQVTVDFSNLTNGWEDSAFLLIKEGANEVSRVTVYARTEGPRLTSLKILNAPGQFDTPFRPDLDSLSYLLDGDPRQIEIEVGYELPTEAVRVQGPLQGKLLPMTSDPMVAVTQVMLPPLGKSTIVFLEAISGKGSSQVKSTIALDIRRKQSPPSHVQLQKIVTGNQIITTVFKPPTSNGGSPILGYIVSAVAQSGGGGRRLSTVTDSDVQCTPAPCWVGGQDTSTLDCCIYTITNVLNGIGYSIEISAKNAYAPIGGNASIPVMSPQNFPWIPVVSSVTPPEPSINAPPTVGKYIGYVLLSIDTASIVTGGAIPVGDYICTSNPGGISGTSSDPSEIRVNGLDPNTEYEFTCGFKNSRGSNGSATPLPSPQTVKVTPKAAPPPQPPIVVMLHAMDDADPIDVIANVSTPFDEYAEDVFCIAMPDYVSQALPEAQVQLSILNGTGSGLPPGLLVSTANVIGHSGQFVSLTIGPLDRDRVYGMWCSMSNKDDARGQIVMLSDWTQPVVFAQPPIPAIAQTPAPVVRPSNTSASNELALIVYLTFPRQTTYPIESRCEATKALASIVGDCVMTNNCVSSLNYPGSYGNSQSCTVTILRVVSLNLQSPFAVESGNDLLRIGGSTITSSRAVPNSLNAGEQISWSTDGSTTMAGWMICLAEASSSWSFISSSAACDSNNDGIIPTSAGYGYTLASCQSKCEGTNGCVAIDYYLSGWCSTYDAACTSPLRTDGASYKIQGLRRRLSHDQGTTYRTQTIGFCFSQITSLDECSAAAEAIGLGDTTALDDGQSGANFDPPYCYYEDGSLKYNSDGQNSGGCSSTDMCVCKYDNNEASCSDTDNGAVGQYGYSCSSIATLATNPSMLETLCANYDDADFTSNQMCCVCGGGSGGIRSQEVGMWSVAEAGCGCAAQTGTQATHGDIGEAQNWALQSCSSQAFMFSLSYPSWRTRCCQSKGSNNCSDTGLWDVYEWEAQTMAAADLISTTSTVVNNSYSYVEFGGILGNETAEHLIVCEVGMLVQGLNSSQVSYITSGPSDVVSAYLTTTTSTTTTSTTSTSTTSTSTTSTSTTTSSTTSTSTTSTTTTTTKTTSTPTTSTTFDFPEPEPESATLFTTSLEPESSTTSIASTSAGTSSSSLMSSRTSSSSFASSSTSSSPSTSSSTAEPNTSPSSSTSSSTSSSPSTSSSTAEPDTSPSSSTSSSTSSSPSTSSSTSLSSPTTSSAITTMSSTPEVTSSTVLAPTKPVIACLQPRSGAVALTLIVYPLTRTVQCQISEEVQAATTTTESPTTSTSTTTTEATTSCSLSIAAGEFHSMILKTDGSVHASGRNGYGQLGDGTNSFGQNLFVQVVADGVKAVTAGKYYSMILKTDGSVHASGRNDYGQLGDGTNSDKNLFVQVVADGVNAVTAGNDHSMILKTDGSVHASGYNYRGQLGDGTNSDKNLFVQVVADGVNAVTAGQSHSMILKTDGSVHASGSNENGQLGDGTNSDKNLFVQVIADGVNAVTAGAYQSMILKTDGSVHASGWNGYGQLGDGTNSDKNLFVQVVADGVNAVTAGNYHSMILKTDGPVHASGYNYFGQLGDGNNSDKNLFVQVVADRCQACSDTNNGTSDRTNYNCAVYSSRPDWCGLYDDSDFYSNEMCCACGGGVQAVYHMTNVDTNSCPTGYAAISSIVDCQVAAGVLGRPWWGSGTWPSGPGGCLSDDYGSNYVSFNAHSGVAQPFQRKVCKATTSCPQLYPSCDSANDCVISACALGGCSWNRAPSPTTPPAGTYTWVDGYDNFGAACTSDYQANGNRRLATAYQVTIQEDVQQPTPYYMTIGTQNGVTASVQCEAFSQEGHGSGMTLPSMQVAVGIPVVSTISVTSDASEKPGNDALRTILAVSLETDTENVVVAGAVQNGDTTIHECHAAEIAPAVRRLSTTYNVQYQVTVPSSSNTATMKAKMNNLPSSPTFQQAVSATNVVIVSAPLVASVGGFYNSNLSALLITGLGCSSACPATITPPFSPGVYDYDVKVNSLSYQVDADPQSSTSGVQMVYNGVVTGLPRTFTVTAVAPAQQSFEIQVVSGSGQYKTYRLRVSYDARPCVPDCAAGITCDGLLGQCQCPSGYEGERCDKSKCPTTTSEVCSGNGFCQSQGNVSKCLCDPGWTYHACIRSTVYKDALSRVITVNLVWGIESYRKDNTSRPLLDSAFDYTDELAQEFILETVEAARDDASLRARWDKYTFPEAFRDQVKAWGCPWPVAKAANVCSGDTAEGSKAEGVCNSQCNLTVNGYTYSPQWCFTTSVWQEPTNEWCWCQAASNCEMRQLVTRFFDNSTNARLYGKSIGTQQSGYDGRIFYVSAEIKIDVLTNLGAAELEPHYDKWKSFVDSRNSRAPSTAKKMVMVSNQFTEMAAALGVVNSTITSFLFSVGFTFFVVLLFTGNIILACYTAVTILLTVASLFGFLIYVMDWQFGPMQAVGVIFFVGLSVDYCLHICHAYNMSFHEERYYKVQEALVELGSAVMGGAITTIGSVAFLWPCWIYLFVQLGVMIFANMLLALLFTFFFLIPLLMVLGPTGHQGSVFYTCQRFSRKDVRKQLRVKRHGAMDLQSILDTMAPMEESPGGNDGVRFEQDAPAQKSVGEPVEVEQPSLAAEIQPEQEDNQQVSRSVTKDAPAQQSVGEPVEVEQPSIQPDQEDKQQVVRPVTKVATPPKSDGVPVTPTPPVTPPPAVQPETPRSSSPPDNGNASELRVMPAEMISFEDNNAMV